MKRLIFFFAARAVAMAETAILAFPSLAHRLAGLMPASLPAPPKGFDVRFPMFRAIVFAAAAQVLGTVSQAAEWKYKDRLLAELARQVPEILKTYDAKTGRFGSGIWICRDQHAIYPLAVAYATAGAGNRHHKDARLLEVIMRGGDALIDDMDQAGQWMFRKKDGSTWGKIWMPWTYSRWIRTYGLIRDDMPPDRRDRWRKALELGYTGISTKALDRLHNIPAHHAMGLYAAGKYLDRPGWCKQATEFLARIAASQSPAGYWAEGGGPVVRYNYVYVEALGVYYAMSGDRQVLPALERAAGFHYHFTYPDGRDVETIDQRNPYHHTVAMGNVGLTLTSLGRAHLQRQWAQPDARLDADLVASLLQHGEEGNVAETPGEGRPSLFALTEEGVDRALVVHRGPWMLCLSAFTTPVSRSRWHQDRQNFVSIFHKKTGLILGGGNTKLQPAWSNFTVGDVSLLSHRSGDTNPNFLPRGELYHVPSSAKILREPEPRLELTYGRVEGDSPVRVNAKSGTVPHGAELCTIRIRIADDDTLVYAMQSTVRSGLPVAAHLALLPRLGQVLETAAGHKAKLGSDPIELSGDRLGGWIAYAGCRLRVPASASLHWPRPAHNPYTKDGRSELDEARIEIRIPLDAQRASEEVTLEILEGKGRRTKTD